jgi:hypothetical protein
LADVPGGEASKPSKPVSVLGSVGFVGATPANSPKIEAKPDQPSETHILADSVRSEATKPSEPSNVGFVGATPANPLKIEAKPDPAKLALAIDVLNRAGVRVMKLDGIFTIGVWSDLDSPKLREALQTLDLARLPFLYLDGPGVPMRYKVRHGEQKIGSTEL